MSAQRPLLYLLLERAKVERQSDNRPRTVWVGTGPALNTRLFFNNNIKLQDVAFCKILSYNGRSKRECKWFPAMKKGDATLKQFRVPICILIVCMLLCLGCAPAARTSDPTILTVWHYYNGAQKQAFDELVSEFNDTIGSQKNIVVTAYNQGSVNELIQNVLDALNEKVGAPEAPDIFAAYADTAYEVYRMGRAADLSKYCSDEELAAYVPAYLSEGMFSTDKELTVLPIAKSTEIFMLNKTDWDIFADATGASMDSFATWEGIAETARMYYEWTDAQTPDIPEDGRAFFGRDAMANYQIIGSLQLGTELFKVEEGKVTLQLDKDAFRRMWDAYYIPYINGYFTAVGRFRSDDAKTGEVIALVGSTTGATFFPQEVTRDDGSSYPIEVLCFLLPNFEGKDDYAVQQGAGMAVTKSNPEREAAAMEFLRWFTAPEQNLEYCIETGYLPVQIAANSQESIAKTIEASEVEIAPIMQESLLLGGQIATDYHLYTSKGFENGNAARQIVDTSMQDRATADRAAVLALIEAGATREEAVAKFITDANFDKWFAEFTNALETVAN